jgi:hypothetical protein
MIVQEGKYYKTRDGRKVGPAYSAHRRYEGQEAFEVDGPHASIHRADGTYAGPNCRDLDLIAEWTDGPVRTVTRREIVRGQYADVDVGERLEIPDCDNSSVPPVRKVAVAYAGFRSSAELKAAAAVLLELAGALE